MATRGGVLSRIGASVKAFQMRFVTTSRRASTLVGIRSSRDAQLVGDGRNSSIVEATLGWIGRNYPEAPVRVRKRVGTELEEIDEGPIADFLDLLRFPNDRYSGVLLAMAYVVDYWADGNAYILKVRVGGRPAALWWVPSWTMEPAWSDDDPTTFVTHYRYRPSVTTEYRVEPEDVIHLRYGFDPDNPRKGRSPLKAVLREILTDDEAAAYTAALLRNLGIPGIVISPGEDVDLDDEDAIAIKEQFRGQFGGDKRGDPLVLGAKATVSVLSFSPQQMDLKALRRIPEERVSAVTGVPAIVAGLGAGLDRSTFANFAEAREAGYEENLIPTQRLHAADFQIQLLPDFVPNPRDFLVDFDVSDVRVLQEDQNKIWERAGSAVARGAITISDFNRIVGLPVDEKLHDVYLRGAQTVAVRVDSPEATGEEPPPPPEPSGPPIPPEAAQGNPPDATPPGTAPMEPMAGAPNGNGSTPPPVPAGR